MEDKDFIGNIFPQKCGDSLKILKKTNLKTNNRFLFEGEFQKYKYRIIFQKVHAINGNVNNPKIEIEEFINKEWIQNKTNDILLIKKKILEGNNKGKWECESKIYKNIVYAYKQHIVSGNVFNPLYEEIELNKKYKQNNKDFFVVIDKKDGEYIGYFEKYENIYITTRKSIILKGEVSLFQINNLLDKQKIWKQKCGNSLEILEDIPIKKENKLYYKVKFLNTNYITCARLDSIKSGQVWDPNYAMTLYTKDYILNFINANFKDKPNLKQLSESLNISKTYLSNLIIKHNLKDEISYYPNYQEDIIINFIKSFNIDIESNSFKYLKDKEIDIFVPSLKIGFEYNGNYWHCDKFKKQNYHQEKVLLAEKKGIKLFNIWEWELEFDKEKIFSYIKSKLGFFDNKIGARSCVVKEIKKYKEYADFCNKNHLQGECGAKVKLGLYYKEKLIQVMSFGSPRFTDKYNWEILRECSEKGYLILGGKQKLWKYFVKNYKPTNCISYCDFSKFTGDSYLKLGFKLERLNKAGFWWLDNKNYHFIYWRDPFNNKKLKDKGYHKLYDCGQLVFVWNKI